MHPRNGPFPPVEHFIPLNPACTYENGGNTEIYSWTSHIQAEVAPVPGVPWKNMVYERNPVGLHMEIISFFHFIGPQKMDEFIRSQIVDRITCTIKSRFPSCGVDTFGSFKTGLFLPYSDIDIVLYVDGISNNILSDVTVAIQEDGLCDDRGVRHIDKASIPVVKFFDNVTLTPVDICCNVPNSEKSVILVNNYISSYPNISPLFFVLKEILCERKLNEVYAGGLPSYALFLMIVSFFQLHPRNDASSTNANVGVLLLEFLELYGCNINFELSGIRITGGGSYVAKKDIRLVNGDVPSALYIEDPLKEGSDVAKSTFNVVLIQKTFAHCYYALDGLLRGVSDQHTNPNEFSFLRSIIQIPDEFMNARRRYDRLRSNLDINLLSHFHQPFIFHGSYPQNTQNGIASQYVYPLDSAGSIYSDMSAFPPQSLPLSPQNFPTAGTVVAKLSNQYHSDSRSGHDAKENRRDKCISQSDKGLKNIPDENISKKSGVKL